MSFNQKDPNVECTDDNNFEYDNDDDVEDDNSDSDYNPPTHFESNSGHLRRSSRLIGHKTDVQHKPVIINSDPKEDKDEFDNESQVGSRAYVILPQKSESQITKNSTSDGKFHRYKIQKLYILI